MKQHSTDDATASSMRLLLPNATVLEDEEVLSVHELKTDAVLHLVLAVSDTEWEPVDIISTDLADA